MNALFRLVSCAVALCAGVPASATTPISPPPTSAPAQFEPSVFAAHLEAELTAAHEVIERHGERLESLVSRSPLGRELVTGVGELRATLPLLIRVDEHLFEELFGELATLEQLGEALASEREPTKPRAHAGGVEARGAGLKGRLRTHLRQGISPCGPSDSSCRRILPVASPSSPALPPAP